MKEEVKKEKLEQALNEEELAKATGGYAFQETDFRTPK